MPVNRQMNRKKSAALPSFVKIILVLVLAGLVTAVPVRVSRADIMIMPIRVVFESRQRVTDLLVLNNGDDTATFRLSWLYQIQNEKGDYITRPGPADPRYDVGKMVIFSPRQMTLPPNGRQRVRMSLRRPPDLPDGEYHAHLRLQRIGSGESPGHGGKTSVQTYVSINIGFGVPVIVRQGRGSSAATISAPHFVKGSADGTKPPVLAVTLNRTGNFGTMGVLHVYWTPKGGNEKQIGQANNVNVFTEVTHRDVAIPLSESRVIGGTVRVVYEGDGPDKGTTFDEKSFPVGG